MWFRRLREYARFMRSLFQTTIRLMWGMWKLTKLPHPAITVFGGSRIAAEEIHAVNARILTKLLASKGFSIITGGGPGIMEAANRGAIEWLQENHKDTSGWHKKIISAGIGMINLNQERVNPYVQESIVMDHFFARKWLLVRYSIGFVIFPGGFGTLDELGEIMTLVQCNRMARVPIVLIDKNYWAPLISWIKDSALAQGLIDAGDETIITVVDDPVEACEIITRWCSNVDSCVFLQNTAKN